MSHRWIWAGALLAVGTLAFGLRLRSVLDTGHPTHEESVSIAMADEMLGPAGHWRAHGGDHPALGIYLIAASGRLFGRSLAGFRMLSVIGGTLTVLLVGLAVARSASRAEGLLAALLLAIDGFHVGLSSRAVMVYHQTVFVTAAWACLAALPVPGVAGLAAAGALLGLGFLCNESSALVGIGWVLAGVLARRCRGRDLLIACGVFLAVISPDIVYNLGAGRPDHDYVNYLDHLDRIARPALRIDGLAFFLRDALNAFVTHSPRLWVDIRCEYPGPGIVLGLVLLAGWLHSFSPSGDPTRGMWRVPPLLFVLVLTFTGPAYSSDFDPPNWTWGAPVVGLVAAGTARMIWLHWRRAWPLLLAAAYLMTRPTIASVRPCV